jgi:putative Holliday junction resolvase
MPIVAIKELRKHLPPKTRLLGVDHGEKTLGLALSNHDLTIATPFKTLERTKFTENVGQLAKICKEYEVAGFVIGLPVHMNGDEGRRAESVRSFGNNLVRVKDLLGFEPVIAFWDERLSTSAMERFLIEQADASRKRRDDVIDKLAAQHILQGALDSLVHTNG